MDQEKNILSVEDIRYEIDRRELLKGISLEIPRGSFVGIIGPNGSGKSTLLKTIYRTHKPSGGSVYLNGTEMSRMSNKEIARQMAVVAQENADINRPHFQTARCQKPTGSQPGPVGFLYFSARLHRMWNFDCHSRPGVGGMPM